MPMRRSRTARRTLPAAAFVGWSLVGVGLLAYFVNELTADIPALHYGMYAVIFAGGWLGLRHLR